MLLFLDLGNSRVKWALHSGKQWLAQGAVVNQQVDTMAHKAWLKLPQPDGIVGVNVAGERMRLRVEAQLTRWQRTPRWIKASRSACGVSNLYQPAERLGADRWAALIAAWHLLHSSCVVVNAGTAITVDALDEQGIFRGGLILPGLQMMCQALADHTAELHIKPGSYQDFPTNTANAIWSGALLAATGAIEAMRSRLALGGVSPSLLISGGATKQLQAQLCEPYTVVDNLVLEGIKILSESS